MMLGVALPRKRPSDVLSLSDDEPAVVAPSTSSDHVGTGCRACVRRQLVTPPHAFHSLTMMMTLGRVECAVSCGNVGAHAPDAALMCFFSRSMPCSCASNTVERGRHLRKQTKIKCCLTTSFAKGSEGNARRCRKTGTGKFRHFLCFILSCVRLA